MLISCSLISLHLGFVLFVYNIQLVCMFVFFVCNILLVHINYVGLHVFQGKAVVALNELVRNTVKKYIFLKRFVIFESNFFPYV